MTLDQIWFCLCEIDVLKNSAGGSVRKGKDAIGHINTMRDEQGRVKGRAADGTVIYRVAGGPSLMSKLNAEDAAKKRAGAEKRRKNRRGRKIGS